MTYAMWGIVVALALMFGVSLRRYRRSLLRKRDIRWLENTMYWTGCASNWIVAREMKRSGRTV